ncbi:sulfotransferase 1A1 [Aplysia californica]|uniref:Sulfotransferase 1A1 n=1 Tax=Aplysia californica TaxID=6500 RepID=A0ABM0JV72_APLCA|nr:sulfotransferase 1A1 [Aplysia californica]
MTSFSNAKVLATALEKFDLIETTLFDGIRFAPYDGLMKDVPTTMDHISNAKLKENDVIACGYMRSGHHWMFEILNMIQTQKVEFSKDNAEDHFLEFMNDKVDETLEAISEPRVITSHLQPKFLPKDVVRKPVKVVFYMRNPKDVLTSWYNLVAKYKPELLNYQWTWEEFLELQLAGEYLWGSWFEHVLAWEKFMSDNPEVPVFVAQYEKLKEQPADVIRDLCRFLGQPDTLAEQIATATSFDNMKAGTEEKSKILSDRFLSGHLDIAVVGLIKSWKGRFTVEQSERFNKAFEEKLAGSEFGNRLRKYIY